MYQVWRYSWDSWGYEGEFSEEGLKTYLEGENLDSFFVFKGECLEDKDLKVLLKGG